jgi:hypothetical protein
MTIGLMSLALVGSTVGNSFRATAVNGNDAPPEAMLTVEYPAGTLLSTAVSKIKAQLPNKNLNAINVVSISNKLDFDGKTQTFSKSNDESKSATDFVNGFKKSQNAFLKTLAGFKQADTKKQNYENKEAISPLVKKYSSDTISKTQAKYSKNPTTITGLTITGSLANIKTLNNVSKLGASSVNFVDILAQQKQFETIQAKTAGITDEAKKMEIINQEIQKALPAEAKQQLANAPKLDNISQEKIMQIDALVKTDIAGNKFVNTIDLKEKLGLSDNDSKEVVKMINQYNQLPTDLKDGTVVATQSIATTEANNQAMKDENTPLEKVVDLITNLNNGVTANAACDSYFGGSKWYWGVSISNSKCGWDGVKYMSYAIQAQKMLWAWACSTVTLGLCFYINVVISVILFLIGQQAGRAVDVANVCPNRRSKINLSISPSVQIFTPLCD